MPAARVPAALVLVAVLAPGCLEGALPANAAASASGVVSAAHPLAAEAGAAVLRAGGNAFDAAAAVQFALNVVEPQMSGIGGGTMLLARLANGTLVFLDGRETAPAASTPDQFLGPDGEAMPFAEAHTRGTAVGVPGTVALFARALAEHGTLALAETLAPAIALAEDGFVVNAYLAEDVRENAEKLRASPASARTFLPGAVCADAADPLAPPGAPRPGARAGCVGGAPLAPGDRLVQPDLARTLRLLAEEGPRALYEGEIAEGIVAAVADREGRMTRADLAAYAVEAREPILSRYRDLEVAGAPPPSSGGIAMAQALGILEPFELGARGAESSESLHLLAEAMRLAYADRAAWIGDPAFVDVPVAGLLDPRYLAERRALIDPARANPDIGPGRPAEAPARGGGLAADSLRSHTSHFAIADALGNVVSVTTTIEEVFGTGITVPGYGFLLNNQLTDFDFEPGGPNQVEGGKRPRSSMTPTIAIRDGEPALALGASGGPRIIAATVQSFLNVVEHGMTLEEAIAAPRIYAPGFPELYHEPALDADAVAALAAMGHAPNATAYPAIANAQGIARGADGAWAGAADDRANEGGVATMVRARSQRS